MPVTAEGIFKIVDQASDPIKKIRTAAGELDKAIAGAGKQLDQLDSTKNIASIKTAGKEVKGFGREGEVAEAKLKRFTENTGRGFEKMAAKGTASIEELTVALKQFEHERATATLDVNIAKAEAKIRLIKEQLRSVSTQQAREELKNLGLIADSTAASLGGGIGGGGGSPGGLAGGFMAAGGRALFMASALAAALPALVAIGGAVSALVGSLGAAVGGAGALGIGTLGAFVVGIGSIIAVAKPAMSALKETKKAQDAYNKSVQQYGRDSAQAVKAHEALIRQQRRMPGAGQVLASTQALGNRWRRITRPAQGDFFGLINDSLRTANVLLPTFGHIANRVLSGVRQGVDNILRPLRSNEWRDIFTVLGDTFAKLASGPLSHAIANAMLFFGRIARAASPLVIDMFDSLNRWLGGLARSAADQNRVRSVIASLVDHTKEWVHFLGAAFRLMGAFFGSGAQQGKDMLQGITDQLNKWTDWIHTHPQEMHDFFARTIDAAGKLVHALGQIAATLGRIGDAMLPILNIVSDIVGTLGGAGLLGPAAGLGAAAFLGRKFGGGGAGGGGLIAGMMGGGGTQARRAGGFLRMAARGGGFIAGADGMQAVGRAGALRMAGGAAISSLARFAAPLVGVGAVTGALSGGGSVLDRWRNFTHGGLGILGLGGLVQSSGQRDQTRLNQDMAALQSAMAGLPQGNGIRAVQGQIGGLQGMLGRVNRDRSSTSAERTAVASAIQSEIDARRQLLPWLRQERRDRQVASGHAFTASTQQAFNIDVKNVGLQKAYENMLNNIERGMRSRKGPGAKVVAADGLAMAREIAQQHPKLKGQYMDLANAVEKRFSDMQVHVDRVNGNIYSGSNREWKKIRDAIADPAEQARERASNAFTKIQESAIGSLMGMGYSRAQAQRLVRQSDASGHAPAASTRDAQHADQFRNATKGPAPGISSPFGPMPGSGTPFGAKGMRIPGVGTRDNVPLMLGMAAPGELIVNRHTERRIAQKYGVDLGAEVAGETRSHSEYARGGRLTSGGGLHAGIQAAANAVLSHFPGLSITSTTGGKHAAGSYHYKGEAVDIGGPAALMNQAAAWIAKTMGGGLTEGIHNPNLSIAGGRRVTPSYWGASTWAEHSNHIHLAVAGALQAMGLTGAQGGNQGALAPQSIHLRRMGARAGMQGALERANWNAISLGMERHVNRRLGRMAGGNLAGFSGGGSNSANQTLAHQMMLASGWGNDQWGPLKALWMRESGFNATARNPSSGAFGIPQALPASKMGAAAVGGDPAAQIRWGLRYIKGRYGSPSAAWAHETSAGWYGHGGRLPVWGGWHRDGGSFTAHRPTMIGVGEGGAERVKVTPLSNSTGKGRPHVMVHIGHITNHEPGDISKIVKRELEKVAHDLDFGSIDGEDELG